MIFSKPLLVSKHPAADPHGTGKPPVSTMLLGRALALIWAIASHRGSGGRAKLVRAWALGAARKGKKKVVSFVLFGTTCQVG